MTWDTLKGIGRGTIVLCLEIAGYPFVFTSYDWTPTDSWYADAYYDAAKPWLRHEGVDLGDISRFIEGHSEVDDISLQVVDIGGEMTGQLKDFAARAWTRLAAPVSPFDASIVLLDATVLPSSGRAWLGQEAVHYTSRTATTLTCDRRGDLGTVARAYQVDYSREPPIGVVVADGPTDIRGRPCRVHVAVTDPVSGEPGPTTVLYRGFVSQEAVIGRARWQIPIDHISLVLDRSVGQDLPSVPVRTTYHYSGDPDSISTVYFQQVGTYGVPYEITVAGTFANQHELAWTFNQESVALPSTIEPTLYQAGEKWGIYVAANASVHLVIDVRYGDPLWAIGFEPGTIVQDRNTILRREADEKPRLLVADWTSGYQVQINVETDDGLSTDLWAALPGHPFAKIYALLGNQISFLADSQDPVREELIWTVDEEEDMRLSHVFAFSGDPADPDTLVDAMRRALYLLPGQDEPESWCAFGLDADDIDFDELETALTGIPAPLNFFYDALTEGMSPKDLFGPRLGVLGIAPRITDEGRLGFVRIETPTPLSVLDIELNDEVWAAVQAAETEARLGGDPLLTQAKISAGYDYRADKWPKPTTINWVDGIADRGRVRSVSYKLRGIAFSDRLAHLPDTLLRLEQLLAPWLTAIHYGLFGRLSADLVIPSTWTAKQFKVGDQIVITHPLAPDLVEGRIGVDSRPGIIIGRSQPVTEDRPDELIVKIPPRSRASGIAPCALAGSWNPGTLTLSFPSADTPKYAAEGGNDLTEFRAGDDVYLWEYDVETPSGGYPLLVTPIAIDTTAKTVNLGFDPFPGPFPTAGVWMTWPDWDHQSHDWQQDWLSIADSAYGLGTAPDEGFTWGV